MSRRTPAVALLIAVALVAGTVAWTARVGRAEPARSRVGPARHLGAQGRVGQFVAKCAYSHSAEDDPIVHFGHPGRSHRHDFYGAVAADASSTADVLTAQGTTCDKRADTAAYWHPTLYDGDEIVEPNSLVAYYRAAPGVAPAEVEVFPPGLAMIAGDSTARAPQRGEAAGWACGSSTRLSSTPPDCPARAPLHMVLTFPDCWDGRRLDSDDHVSHVAYSATGTCPSTPPGARPATHRVDRLPDLGNGPCAVARVRFGVLGARRLLERLGPDGLRREVEACINRDVVCDLASNRAEEAPFFAG